VPGNTLGDASHQPLQSDAYNVYVKLRSKCVRIYKYIYIYTYKAEFDNKVKQVVAADW